MSRGIGSLGQRYAPLLVLAAIQLVIIVVAPSRGADQDTSALAPLPGQEGPLVPGGPQGSATPGAGGVPTTGSGPGSTPGVSNPGSGPAGYISSDKSKCAPGGVLQQRVSRISPQCVGRWVGNNGGSTYQGVTSTTIRVVFVRTRLPQGFEPIFVQGGLGTTREQDEAHIGWWAKFYEKHYEWYGRKVEWITTELACDAADPNFVGCARQQARVIVKTYKPFIVFSHTISVPEFWDEMTRLKVINMGGFHNTARWNLAHRPYHWDVFADGTRIGRNLASYWCQRMAGKNASLAGDPTMRPKPRKLGVLVEQLVGSEGVFPEVARDFSKLISGGTCGSASTKPVLVFYSGDIQRATDEMTAATQALIDEDVTTVTCLCTALTPIFMTQAMDDQQYFPEHLIAGSGSMDIDLFGRLYTQSQWKNAFGISYFTTFDNGYSDYDQVRQWRDVGAPGEPCKPCGGYWLFMDQIAYMLQWAGPHPTPLSLEAGAFQAPAIGGWIKSKGDPTMPLIDFAPNDYTGIDDAKQVYWSATKRSGLDGQLGAYFEVDGAHRYVIGAWTTGQPKQP
ncbi:MAG: hypothetical protein ACRDJ1_09840 [Actinomycetota bacterium]